METLHSCADTGERPGETEHQDPDHLQQHPQQRSLPRISQKARASSQQKKTTRRHNPERRTQQQSPDLEAASTQEASAAPEIVSAPGLPKAVQPPSEHHYPQSSSETQDGNPKQKSQRPGKYVCTYCGRACAKPSVLQKHIRSHTGERPYPCTPCGFSFKTKSNLYKHRKSHTHKVKAGLALRESKPVDEHITKSEDEPPCLLSASSYAVTCPVRDKDSSGASDDSYAVKKRLALRLSRGKHAPQDTTDQKSSSLLSSTESGYFSRSESTEQSQDSPPNTSAKSYAEIILGKYGRLGQLQRTSPHQSKCPPGPEDKNISFTVPKKQVIEHITKLITINEAVVDTSKLDSVKPRRSSLCRKNSSESQKMSPIKEPRLHCPVASDVGYKSTGSISMGLPCEKFHHASLKVDQVPTASLVRSQSLPSPNTSFDAPCGTPSKIRLSQSFDEQQPSQSQMGRRCGRLRRQPAIEIPLESTEETLPSEDPETLLQDYKQHPQQTYEFKSFGTVCKNWDVHKEQEQTSCHIKNEGLLKEEQNSQLSISADRAGVLTVRKRRKEESIDLDEPSLVSSTASDFLPGKCKNTHPVAHKGARMPARSVIQHTSSFEKQENSCCDDQKWKVTNNSMFHEERQTCKPHLQQSSVKHPGTKLLRQNKLQLPEILVTEDYSHNQESSVESTSTGRVEKSDDFQWPQRSTSLSQLPIEKLPPKKKRLRLAEAAQSSGDSSFDSVSLPCSPSQDGSASYASFEEPSKAEKESTSLRRSRAPNMLTVPGAHQQRDMRRSASEQGPHDPHSSALMSETRSKSLDYSCVSPERSAFGWKERRKCLLKRHAAIRDGDDEECAIPEPVSPHFSSQVTQASGHSDRFTCSPSSGKMLVDPDASHRKETFFEWKYSPNFQMEGTQLSTTFRHSVDETEEASSVSPEKLPPQTPIPSPTRGPSGAARAHYMSMSTGLKLEIRSQHDTHSDVSIRYNQQGVPHVSPSLELIRPSCPAVAVRLQADTLIPAGAIYTTLSQPMSPRPQEAAVTLSVTEQHRKLWITSSHLQPWPDDGTRSGGNKRVLSPSSSVEFPPDSPRQQKRVKEAEDSAETADTHSQELRPESDPLHFSSVASSVQTSFPSLLSTTCNSWCYLKYTKPNPSTQDKDLPSVYASWSTSTYDPNPPGLTSRVALSLLLCKQRLSPSIYTTSTMSAEAAQSMADHRPLPTEVYYSPSSCRDQMGVIKRLGATEDNSGKREEMEERTQDGDHEGWMSKSGSELLNVKDWCVCSCAQDDGATDSERQNTGADAHTHSEAGRSHTTTHKSPSADQDTLAKDTPVKDTPVRDMPMKDTSVNNTEVKDTPVNEIPTNHMSIKESAVKDTPINDTTKKDTTKKETPVKDMPLNVTPIKDTPLKDTPVKDNPSQSKAGANPDRIRSLVSSQQVSTCIQHLCLPPSPSPSPGPAPGCPDLVQGSADAPVPSEARSEQQPPAGRQSDARWAPVHSGPPPPYSTLLSHLPLHSQPSNRTPNLLIPLGGLHMIQPRSSLPVHSPVGCRTGTATEPAAGNPRRDPQDFKTSPHRRPSYSDPRPVSAETT